MRTTVTDWPTFLRTFRKRHGLTQKQLAEKLSDNGRNVGLRTVQHWEDGDRTPTPYLKRALRDLQRELTAR